MATYGTGAPRAARAPPAATRGPPAATPPSVAVAEPAGRPHPSTGRRDAERRGRDRRGRGRPPSRRGLRRRSAAVRAPRSPQVVTPADRPRWSAAALRRGLPRTPGGEPGRPPTPSPQPRVVGAAATAPPRRRPRRLVTRRAGVAPRRPRRSGGGSRGLPRPRPAQNVDTPSGCSAAAASRRRRLGGPARRCAVACRAPPAWRAVAARAASRRLRPLPRAATATAVGRRDARPRTRHRRRPSGARQPAAAPRPPQPAPARRRPPSTSRSRCRSPGRCGRAATRSPTPAPTPEAAEDRPVHAAAVGGCGDRRRWRAAVRGGDGGAVRAMVPQPRVHAGLPGRLPGRVPSCPRVRRWGCRRGWAGSTSSTCS